MSPAPLSATGDNVLSGLLWCRLSDPNLEGKSVAQRGDVPPQGGQGQGVIAPLLNPGHLGLRYAQTLGQFHLRHARSLARLDQLEPQLLLGRFLLIDRLEFGIGRLVILPLSVAGFALSDRITPFLFCAHVVVPPPSSVVNSASL